MEVGAVARHHLGVAQGPQLLVVDPALVPGDLLDAADLVALPGLDDVDELAGVHEALEGPRVEPGRAARQHRDGEVVALQVGLVDGRDLELATVARCQPAGDLHDVVVVEVQPGHRVAAPWVLGLLLDRSDRAVLVELHDAVGAGVAHVVREDVATADIDEPREGSAEPGAVEDVVAEHQGDGVVADEVRADDEGLGQALGPRLDRVGDLDAPLGPVAEEADELVAVVGSRDDEDLPDAGHHQCRQRVVDHRLVVDGHQLLGDRTGDRVQSRARAAGEDDALHGRRA